MTIVSWGWQGTIDEIQWSRMASLLGNNYCVDAPASLLPTAVAGQRKVNIPTGVAFGKGIASQVTAAEQPTIPTPVSGQWSMLVLRRSWAAKTAVLTWLAHTTTTTATPAASTAPTTNPPGFTQNPGVTDDMPVAWVWANSANTTLVIVSLLKLTADVRVDALAATVAAMGSSSDTGWQTLPLAAGATAADGLTPMIRVKNGQISLMGRVLQSQASIAQLSSDKFPLQDVRVLAATGSSGSGAAALVISSTGLLYTAAGTTVNLGTLIWTP